MLRMRGIRAAYGRAEVLHNVDLVVPEGRTVALLGANGAGKTTLLKAAAGLLPVTAGQVEVDGSPVERQSPWRRSRQGICLVPEGRGIFRRLSVRENLKMFVGGRSVGEAINKAATFFPVLGERLEQEAGTLSGGQQQMLAVSRALITNPRLVLADELSVGLAPVIVDQIFAAVEAMREAGRSILIVEQYVHRVLALADDVYVLHKGEIVFAGRPAELEESAIFEHYLGSVA